MYYSLMDTQCLQIVVLKTIKMPNGDFLQKVNYQAYVVLSVLKMLTCAMYVCNCMYFYSFGMSKMYIMNYTQIAYYIIYIFHSLRRILLMILRKHQVCEQETLFRPIYIISYTSNLVIVYFSYTSTYCITINVYFRFVL